MQENQFKDNTQLKDLQDSVNFINEKIQEYKQDRGKKERKIKGLKRNVSFFISVLLHDLEEETNKIANQNLVDLLSKSIDETISNQDVIKPIDFLEKKSNRKSRPVIVNFVNYKTGDLILKVNKT